MDFRKIEYFIEVAKCLNFSKASDKIHISHQALSKQIQSLEEELGASLFERTTAKVILTEVGMRLFQAFQPITEAANFEYTALEEFIKLRKSKIKLGYFNALSYQYVIEPMVIFLQKQKTDLSIDVYAGDIGAIRQSLLDDKGDLIVTVVPDLERWKNVKLFVLKQYPLQIIVSSNHPWFSRKDKVSSEELEKEKLLYYQSGDERFMRHMKVAERISMDNYDNYTNRLYAGKEIGVIADIYSQREGRFRLLDLPKQYQTSIYLICAFKKEHPLKEVFQKLQRYKIQ